MIFPSDEFTDETGSVRVGNENGMLSLTMMGGKGRRDGESSRASIRLSVAEPAIGSSKGSMIGYGLVTIFRNPHFSLKDIGAQ